jgi:hypothetical protein
MEEKIKKERKHREPSKWNLHCAKIREENKGLKASEVMKKAKETYKKE